MEPTSDPLAPFKLLAKRGWNWGLHEFAAHLGKPADDVWVREKYAAFRKLVEGANALGEQTLTRLLEE